MRRLQNLSTLFALAGATVLATGCAQMGRLGGGTAAAPAPATAAAPAATPAAKAPAPASAPAPATPSASGGVNSRGEVIDSSKVASGDGRKVKGREGWEGEITGKPGPGSKFTRLEIGMPMKQVTDMIGAPSDQGVYMSGKAWIPFYFGSDRHRHELVYKGQGRLIFAGPAGFQYGSGNLIWIIHNPNEAAYR